MGKTLGDKLFELYESYIKPSKKPIGKKEIDLIKPNDYDSVLQQSGYEHLTPVKRRKIAAMSPLLMKGIKKKSMDTFRAWFTLETPDGKNPLKIDTQLLADFEHRSQYKKKLYHARLHAHIYGDGYLLITFTNDEEKTLQEPVDELSAPWSVESLNPERISSMRMLNGHLYYVYQDDDKLEDTLIHADRIQHIMIDKLPNSNFGLSTVDILRWTLESNKNVDKATGAILSWFSHGILDLKKEGLTCPERDALLKIAAQHPGAWVHDEMMEIDYKNPTAINPKPFYDYIVLNIAAVLNMPTHVLTGIQTGRVTGSEIGFSDYYRDVRDEQQMVFEPLIEKLYERILIAHGKKWKYVFKWNEIYVDEGMEVEQLVKKVEAANTALQGGFISKKEARRIINDGQIQLDSDDLSELEPTSPSQPSTQKPEVQQSYSQPRKPNRPNPEDNEPRPPQPKIRGGLSQEERAMIQRCKEGEETLRQIIAHKEKELGKKLLEEDEEDA